MDETSDEDEAPGPAQTNSVPRTSSRGLAGVSSSLGASALGLEPPAQTPNDDTQDMSVSTLHLYDLHISQVSWYLCFSCVYSLRIIIHSF